MAHSPDPIPRGRSGDPKVPDFPGVKAGSPRGKYPKDSGGPPQTQVGRGGPSGDPFQEKLTTTTVTRPLPAKSPVANTGVNPIK